MKIIYKKGNALKGPEPYLAHGCNNRGVMGSGIARQIRDNYPLAYEFYRWNHQRNELVMGEVYGIYDHDKYIFNCITQDGYGRDGRRYVSYDAIENCVLSMNSVVESKTSLVAMPMIGAGLGGGNWKTISKIIEENAEFQPVVYEL